jgi:hypothetical protein
VKNERSQLRQPLTLSLLVCLTAPGSALAQAATPKKQALEVRVAELEKNRAAIDHAAADADRTNRRVRDDAGRRR